MRRYFDPERKVRDLRDGVERMKTTGKNAYRLGEVIEKNGPEKWLVPLAEDLGPWAQLQLSDLANFLEILEKYKKPLSAAISATPEPQGTYQANLFTQFL